MKNQEIKINFSDIKTMEEYREYIKQTSEPTIHTHIKYSVNQC